MTWPGVAPSFPTHAPLAHSPFRPSRPLPPPTHTRTPLSKSPLPPFPNTRRTLFATHYHGLASEATAACSPGSAAVLVGHMASTVTPQGGFVPLHRLQAGPAPDGSCGLQVSGRWPDAVRGGGGGEGCGVRPQPPGSHEGSRSRHMRFGALAVISMYGMMSIAQPCCCGPPSLYPFARRCSRAHSPPVCPPPPRPRPPPVAAATTQVAALAGLPPKLLQRAQRVADVFVAGGMRRSPAQPASAAQRGALPSPPAGGPGAADEEGVRGDGGAGDVAVADAALIAVGELQQVRCAAAGEWQAVLREGWAVPALARLGELWAWARQQQQQQQGQAGRQ